MRHISGVLMLCWVRALRAGAIVALATAAAVEIADMVILRRFPPDGVAQLVAAGLAFGLGYAVAITIIADELLVGILDGVGHLLGDAEAGARAAAIAAEREFGEVGSSLFRVAPLGGVATVVGALLDRADRRRVARADPDLVTIAEPRSSQIDRSARGGVAAGQGANAPERAWSMGQVAAWDRDEPRDWPTDETLADLAAQSDDADLAPDADDGEASEAPTVAEMPAIVGRFDEDPAPTGQPVHATELPRIAWDAGAFAAGGVAAAGSSTPMSAPVGAPMSAPPGASGTPGGLAAPASWHQDITPTPDPANWHDPLASAYDEEEEAPGIQPVDAFGAPPPAPRAERADQWADTTPVPPVTRSGAQITRPLPNPTRPLVRGPQPTSPRGSVWDHISQVLAGRPVEPLPAEDDAPATHDGDTGEPPSSDR
jgi:hypothetical protein